MENRETGPAWVLGGGGGRTDSGILGGRVSGMTMDACAMLSGNECVNE